MILPSGGYDHTNQPRQDSLGVFTTFGPDFVTGMGMITAQTDRNGMIQFNYRAPIYSGFYFSPAIQNKIICFFYGIFLNEI